MRETRGTPFWLWLNLLSLDAPIVAVVWQDFLVRCYPSVLLPPARAVLGLTVWAIYLADRLIDTRRPAGEKETPRHRFYRRRRWFAIGLLAVVLAADVGIAAVGLRPDVFANGLATAAAVGLYLVVFALLRIGVKRWKQPAAAVLCTVGIFLVAWTRTDRPWHELAWPAAAFCAVCFANLLMIERWEMNLPAARIWIWLIALAAVCAVLGDGRWYRAVAVAAAGLAALDLSGERLNGDLRHVLADAALLAPLLFR